MVDKPARGDEGRTDEPVKVIDRRWWARNDQAAPDAAPPAGRPSYVEELEQRLAEREEQLRQYAQQVKAAAAEFDEARVRARREVTKEIDRGKRALLAELLDVMDNLDRAIDAGSTTSSLETLLEGVRLVRSQFLSRLEGFGIAPIDALHERFDPTLHEAVTTVPASEADEDRVLGVVRSGYRIGDDVLRPAMVAVGKKVDQVAP
jgi:molecular chaperone GrpE